MQPRTFRTAPTQTTSEARRPPAPSDEEPRPRRVIALRSLVLAGLHLFAFAGFAGQSVGTLDDPRALSVPTGAERVYYLSTDGTDPEASTLPNALGDEQLLYYDIYAPTTSPHARATILYIHGGGYTVGGANYGDTVDAIEQLTALGFWTISIEYRRGWYNDGIGGVVGGPHPIQPEEVALAEEAFELALHDVLAAWDHIATAGVEEYPYPPRYVLIGESAGGSLASRATLIERPDHEILGAILGFGTHSVLDDVLLPAGNAFPVVVQTGLLDSFQPYFDRPLYFQEIMPIAKGTRTLYDELVGAGYPARLLIAAQNGHGFGAYEVCDRPECESCPLDANGDPTFGDDCGRLGTVTHYPTSLAYFEEVYYGAMPESYVEYLFRCEDPLNEIEPGETIRSLDRPDFRYSPYEDDLEAGASPADVITEYELTGC